MNIAVLEQRNADHWEKMHIRASRLGGFRARAEALCATDAKARYEAIAQAVWKKPGRWYFVAVVHEREAGGPPHWNKQLGQGDPLNEASRHDPKGRGPFLTHPEDGPGHDAFHRAALDSLIDCAPHAAKWRLWTTGGVLTLLEEYNGLGYAAMGVPSAYVWSGSDQYVSGKYVADHVYRANAVDVQEGCAPLIATMMTIDNSIRFEEQA